MPPEWVLEALRAGQVIPAHPLALTRHRRLDERRQRALTRYYHAAGAGGVAVGVHTTQFAIRRHGLLAPVLRLAAETLADRERLTGRRVVRIAGICGRTRQAVAEAGLARETSYHVGLLSLASLPRVSDTRLLAHCRAVAEVMPLMGFYLQPAAGGRLLSYAFWRRLAETPNLVGIKVAPFNRYQTLDVVRAVADAGRDTDLALYTGNDDNIVLDLIAEYRVRTAAGPRRVRMVGGLLGHWACETKRAVELLAFCHRWRGASRLPARLLTLAGEVTDCNSALFDAAHGFAGCLPGIHEVLRRQGLLANTLCLDPRERLSPGQTTELDRVHRAYPRLNDDAFVRQHLEAWLAD